MIESIRDLIHREADAIRNIPVGENYEKALSVIHQRVHVQGGKLITSGMGKAGLIARNMATTFCSTGTPAVFLHPSEAQHGDLGVLSKNDVLLLVSNSGKTREILELIELTGKLFPDLPIIAITGNQRGTIAKRASACLHTGAPTEVCPLGLTPTTSTTVMTVIGDVLVVEMMKRIGFTRADYAKRHHGGYLGHVSRKLSETNE
ncbi:MAG TPA: SIS domain-containing protein [Prolixibacteraceae bacterium]|nr:SIS domain-containing protein [Prolixibacteraceae bacterium]